VLEKVKEFFITYLIIGVTVTATFTVTVLPGLLFGLQVVVTVMEFVGTLGMDARTAFCTVAAVAGLELVEPFTMA
jgi:hypothetical protein